MLSYHIVDDLDRVIGAQYMPDMSMGVVVSDYYKDSLIIKFYSDDHFWVIFAEGKAALFDEVGIKGFGKPAVRVRMLPKGTKVEFTA